MKNWFHTDRKLHILLAADLIVLTAYLVLRRSRGFANVFTQHVTDPLRRILGSVCYLTEVSVMEIVYTLFGAACAGFLVWSAVSIVRGRGKRGRLICRTVLASLCILLTVWADFCVLWGFNYWADGVRERMGIRSEEISPEELRSVTEFFARRLADTAGTVPRDEQGIFAASREEILAAAATVYDPLEEEYPFLAFDDPGIKPMRLYAELMSRMNYTGVYSPFLGESNINADTPLCLIPSTICHELGHQRGFASEQECNFLAVLAATKSGDPAYVYSGWLLGYLHLSGALWEADAEAYYDVAATLPESVRADLRDNNEYWAKYEDTPVQKAADGVYDTVLKASGEAAGIRSYGLVVDLLAAWYRDAAAQD